MLDRVSNWTELLASDDQKLFDDVRMHERTGRPPVEMSSIAGRELGRKKSGLKRSEGN